MLKDSACRAVSARLTAVAYLDCPCLCHGLSVWQAADHRHCWHQPPCQHCRRCLGRPRMVEGMAVRCAGPSLVPLQPAESKYSCVKLQGSFSGCIACSRGSVNVHCSVSTYLAMADCWSSKRHTLLIFMQSLTAATPDGNRSSACWTVSRCQENLLARCRQ